MKTILSALFIMSGIGFALMCLLAWTTKVEKDWEDDV